MTAAYVLRRSRILSGCSSSRPFENLLVLAAGNSSFADSRAVGDNIEAFAFQRRLRLLGHVRQLRAVCADSSCVTIR
jgi:hypothetical protein